MACNQRVGGAESGHDDYDLVTDDEGSDASDVSEIDSNAESDSETDVLGNTSPSVETMVDILWAVTKASESEWDEDSDAVQAKAKLAKKSSKSSSDQVCTLFTLVFTAHIDGDSLFSRAFLGQKTKKN